MSDKRTLRLSDRAIVIDNSGEPSHSHKLDCRVTVKGFWTPELQNQFGVRDGLHELSYKEIVNAIIEFGRAELTYETGGVILLTFQNEDSYED